MVKGIIFYSLQYHALLGSIARADHNIGNVILGVKFMTLIIINLLFIELKSLKSNTQSEFFLGWNHEIALDFGTSIVSRADNDAKTSGRGGYESWKPKSNGK